MPTTKTWSRAALLVAAGGLGALAVAAFGPWGGGDAFSECEGGVATGAASIGGPFRLVSETGAEVSSAEAIAGPTLVYFGYTFCPDVCPTDAAAMARAADLLAEMGLNVSLVFVTVDPLRDTPEVLAGFTDSLHPGMLGLGGPPEAVEAAKKAYKVFAQKAPGGDPEYYLVDHSAFTYLMTAPDRFLTVFRSGSSPEAIAETASCHLEALARGA